MNIVVWMNLIILKKDKNLKSLFINIIFNDINE